MWLKLLLLFVTCVFLIPPAFAASFDCKAAAANVERIICNDDKISKLDEELSDEYDHFKDSNKIRDNQRTWIINVRNQCHDIQCLKDAYLKRIALFNKKPNDISHMQRFVKLSDKDACNIVEALANNDDFKIATDIISGISIKSSEIPSVPQLIKLFHGSSDLKALLSEANAPAGYWDVDVDDDGIADHVLLLSSTMGWASTNTFLYISGRKDAEPIVKDSNEFSEDPEAQFKIVTFGGRAYILTFPLGSDVPEALWTASSEKDQLVPVCRLKKLEKPVVKLVYGNRDPVCVDMAAGNIDYVNFDQQYKLSDRSIENGLGRLDPIDGMAQVDIDNDGTLDNVIRMNFGLHFHRFDCDSTYLAIIDQSRSHLIDSDVDKLLLKELGGADGCGPDFKLFVRNKIAFVEVDSDAGNTVAYRIKNSKAEKICDFDGRWQYQVIDPSDPELKR